MKKIRALQQFSHFNGGTFDQHEVRSVADDIAEALIGMGLAEEAEPAGNPSPDPPKKASGKK